MLKTACTNAAILSHIAKAGHGDKVIIVSGNYPVDRVCSDVPKVYVGLKQGVPSSTEVLEIMAELIPIESAEVMLEPDSEYAQVFSEYSQKLNSIEISILNKKDFYEASNTSRVCLVVSTGDIRPWANIILTVGTIRC